MSLLQLASGANRSLPPRARLKLAALVGFALVALVALVPASALADTLLSGFVPTDESPAGYDSVDATRDWAFRVDAPSTWVTSVEVSFERDDASVTDDLTFTIVDDDGGAPGSLVLGTVSVPASSVPVGELGWVTATFDEPVALGPDGSWVILSSNASGAYAYSFLSYRVDTRDNLAFGSGGSWASYRKPYAMPNRVFGSTTPPIIDSDGDGVPDDEDLFPDSDPSQTLVVGGVDLGIDNVALGGGATMLDLLTQAIDGGSNAGQSQSAVSTLLNEWKANGLISGQEKGQITAAVAHLVGRNR